MPRATQDEWTAEFARLIEPHFDRLFRLACRLTGSRSDAEDLLQDVITRLYEQQATLTDITGLKPWLSRVLYNRFVDHTRAIRRRPLTLVRDSTELTLIAEGADPVELTIADERAARLQRSLERLSDDQRTLLLMHDAEGYTLREIEAMTGTPTGTLKSRLSRARARLRELLWDFPEKKMEPLSGNRRVGG